MKQELKAEVQEFMGEAGRQEDISGREKTYRNEDETGRNKREERLLKI